MDCKRLISLYVNVKPSYVLYSFHSIFFSFLKRLANIKAQPSRFVSANLPVNKFKNRLVNILPFEGSRVCLQPLRGTEGSDYINASFIDGYRYVLIQIKDSLKEVTIVKWNMDIISLYMNNQLSNFCIISLLTPLHGHLIWHLNALFSLMDYAYTSWHLPFLKLSILV